MTGEHAGQRFVSQADELVGLLAAKPMIALLRAPEVAYHLQDSDAKVLITFELFAEEAVKGAAEVEGVTTYVVGQEAGRHHDDVALDDPPIGQLHPGEA